VRAILRTHDKGMFVFSLFTRLRVCTTGVGRLKSQLFNY